MALLYSFLALCAILITIYHLKVPKDHTELGNLSTSETKGPFVQDFWPDHGFIDLPYGKTHYYLLGPKNGRKLVFVHGISSPPPTISSFLEKLALKGYRILCYDLYGRGYSDSPGTVYDDGLFISQLAMLIQKLRFENAYIVGYSLGGAITAGYVSRFPENIKGVALIAPAGVMKRLPLLAYLLKIPLLGKLFLHTIGKYVLIRNSARNHIKGRECPEVAHFDDLQRFQILHHPGLMRAFGSTVLHFQFGNYHKRYQMVNQTHKEKNLILWGALDNVVPVELAPELHSLMHFAKLEIHPNTSHSIVIEEPEITAQIIHRHFSIE